MPGVRLRLAGEVQQLQVCSGGEHRLDVHNQPHSIQPWGICCLSKHLVFQKDSAFHSLVVFPSKLQDLGIWFLLRTFLLNNSSDFSQPGAKQE